ncbi:heavy metal-binding domain-containing protein, partial [Enterocloster asparagiformis]
FGSQSEMFSMKLETARESALKNLVKKSVQSGGNAIIGIDFDYITFSNNMIGVVANGTSVEIEPI